MRFPAGGPVPVGVWREAPSPPHPVTAAGTRGPEKRQGSADPAQLRPVAATLFAFASNANFARGRAICPPADCGVCGCYAFAVLISISKFCLPRTDLRYQGSLISDQESAAAAIVRLRAAEGLALSRSSRPALARILSFRAVFRPSDSAAIIRFSHASDVLFVAHLERFDARRLGRFLRLSSRVTKSLW